MANLSCELVKVVFGYEVLPCLLQEKNLQESMDLLSHTRKLKRVLRDMLDRIGPSDYYDFTCVKAGEIKVSYEQQFDIKIINVEFVKRAVFEHLHLLALGAGIGSTYEIKKSQDGDVCSFHVENKVAYIRYKHNTMSLFREIDQRHRRGLRPPPPGSGFVYCGISNSGAYYKYRVNRFNWA